MLELTFNAVLDIYKHKMFTTKVRYSRKLLTDEEYKAEWRINHFWLSELKLYFDNYYKEYRKEDFTPEKWAELQEKYAYKEEKPYALIVYRGVVIPMLADDYGQQDFTVIFGEVRGGGAYNFNAADDFCGMVDYYLEKEYMSNVENEWGEELDPFED